MNYLSPASFQVDIQVLTPRTTYSHGRPAWMVLDNRRQEVKIEVPECRDRWCLVEARAINESPEAIPLDRSEINESDTVWLFLPLNKTVKLNVFTDDGKLIREMNYNPATRPKD